MKKPMRLKMNGDMQAGRRFAIAVGAATLVVGVAGCLTHEDPNTFRIEGQAPSTPPPSVAGAYGYPPEPPVTDSLALHEFAGRFRHHVVLLDFWASWCSRCRQEMPRIVELQETLRSSGFQVISCCLDEPERWSGDIVPMLQSVRANFPCVVVPRQSKSPLRSWLAADWTYTLPARFVIDGNGSVVAYLSDQASIDQVVAEVEQAVRGHASSVAVTTGVELRARLVDVATGEAATIPPIIVNPPNSGALATRLAEAIAGRVRSRTRRIAVLAPCPRKSGPDSAFCDQVGDGLVDHLRRRGYMDLVEPMASDSQLRQRDLSAAAIEFDTTIVKGRINADYLVLGWMSGPAPQQASRAGEAEPVATVRR